MTNDSGTVANERRVVVSSPAFVKVFMDEIDGSGSNEGRDAYMD